MCITLSICFTQRKNKVLCECDTRVLFYALFLYGCLFRFVKLQWCTYTDCNCLLQIIVDGNSLKW